MKSNDRCRAKRCFARSPRAVIEAMEQRILLSAQVVANIATNAVPELGAPAVLPDGRIIFSATDATNGSEPRVSGGTPQTTSLLKDIKPGAASSDPYNFVRWGDAVYFVANASGTGWGIWRTQGTGETTQMLKLIDGGSDPSAPYFQTFVAAGSYLYFLTNGDASSSLWRTDGTSAGTVKLWSTTGAGLSNAYMVAIGSRVYFPGTDANGLNRELWTSDGTPQGTARVKEIAPGNLPSNPQYLTVCNNMLYFVANDRTHGVELWKSDGTADNTAMVADINPVNPGSSFAGPYELDAFDGVIYFAADDGSGKELWRSDGTPQGTYRIKDINPGPAGSYPENLQAVGNRIVFLADDGTHGYEPWVTDGTAQGTMLLKDIYPGSTSTAPGNYHFKYFGGTVLFLADDGRHGPELWQTDGTTDGTRLFADMNPGPLGSTPILYGQSNDWFYFQADDGVSGPVLRRIADEFPPSVSASKWTSPKTLQLQFAEDVSASLSVSELDIRNTQTQAVVSPSSLSYNAIDNVATFIFTTPVTDGDYTVEFQSAAISDAAGNTLAAGVAPKFFILHGDANSDRSVDFADLVAVAQHYGETGLTWSDGDFNDDGAVGFEDLVAVAQAYGTYLPPPMASAVAAPAVTAKLAAKTNLASSKFSKRPIHTVKPPEARNALKRSNLFTPMHTSIK